MKSFLAVCALFVIATVVRGDGTEDVQKYMDSVHESFEACAAEVGVPNDMLVNPTDEMSDEEKNKIGCVHSCVMKKSNVWDGSQFDMDKMKEMVDEIYKDGADGVMKSIETCSTEVKDSTDECAAALTFMGCMKKEME